MTDSKHPADTYEQYVLRRCQETFGAERVEYLGSGWYEVVGKRMQGVQALEAARDWVQRRKA